MSTNTDTDRDTEQFMLDVSQAHEFKLACRRAGITNADIKRMSEGDLLARLLPAIRGLGDVVINKYIVDLDAKPYVPDGWKVEEHTKDGQFEFDPTKIALYLDEDQQNGGVIVGNKLRKKLKGKKVPNANLLEFYLAHPNLIPEEWKGKAVFFWGTIYRDSYGRLCVRYLIWDGGGWRWGYRWLDGGFCGDNPAVVSASN